jgi:quinolinate synthase
MITPSKEAASREQAGLLDRLAGLKARHHAIVLAHNYQPDEVQDAADFTGDSLELSRLAAREQAEVLVFAGVTFMAESAKILSPQKTVLLPVLEAGCPMADTITTEDVWRARQEHPRAAVVSYVNSSAEVKAESDICCTSANAVQVVNSLEQDEIIFVPDKNLADWVARHTSKCIIPWAGSCCTHNNIRPEAVVQAKAIHPQAKFMAHPECRPDVCSQADAVLSTSQMLRYVKSDSGREFIVGTEVGLLHRLRLENPDKIFYPLSSKMVCASMKLTSLEILVQSLENLSHPVVIPESVRSRAVRALDAMLRIV